MNTKVFCKVFYPCNGSIITKEQSTYSKEPLKSGGDWKVKEISKDESGQRITYDPALDNLDTLIKGYQGDRDYYV